MSDPRTIRAAVRSLLTATLLILGLLALSAGFPAMASGSKEYHYGDCRIDATVLPDGSVRFREHRQHVFEGSFHWGKMVIPLSGRYDITDFRMGEGSSEYVRSGSESPGNYSAVSASEGFECKWYYDAEDETRTFWFDYTVRRCVIAHADVAEFYWKYVGSWDEPIDKLTTTLNLPAGASSQDVRAWAHGPLQGEVSIQEVPPAEAAGRKSVRVLFTCRSVPAERMVEGRVVFPKSLVPGCEAKSGKAALSGILAEEQTWADRANRIRDRIRMGGERDRTFWLVGLVLPIALWFFLVYLKYDREFRPAYTGDYERELPADYSPAEMGVLWRFGSPGTQDLTATLLDLARKGHVAIREERVEKKRALGLLGTSTASKFWIEKGGGGETRESLGPHERDLLDLVFYSVGKGAASVSFDDIEDYAKKHPERFQREYASWQKLVTDQAKKHGFFDKTVTAGKIIGAGLGLASGAVGILLAARTYMPITGALLIASGLFVLIKSLVMKRRSREGQEQLARWKAFRRFLLHFSSLDQAEIPALEIWEKYLVYAVSLGVAKQVLDQLKIVFPEVSRGERRFGTCWAMAGLHADAFGGFSHLSHSLNSALVSASKTSSGSGRGGGFSGGGGGGGGGSSGSAG